MAEKRLGQGSFADAFLGHGVGWNARLERIAEHFCWERFERLLRPLRASHGRPGYPTLSLFKALLLQQWYQLSDPGLEEALTDRISFRRFCGFALDEITPDETTFVRFRTVLVEAGMAETLFAEVARQLESKGTILKTGTLIDATLVEAAVHRPPVDEGEVSERDPMPASPAVGRRASLATKPMSPSIRAAIWCAEPSSPAPILATAWSPMS